MKELGVGFMLRKLGATTKPNVRFEKNGDQWTFTTISSIKTIIVKFKLNEEFDEETADGRKVKVKPNTLWKDIKKKDLNKKIKFNLNLDFI